MIDFYLFQLSIPLVWLAAGILVASTELIIPTQISMWSGLACALVALLTGLGLIGDYSYNWQFFWFGIFSTLFILLWFLVIKRYTRFGTDTVDIYRDMSLISLSGEVVDTIEPDKPGSVELYSPFHGIIKWSAESKETLPIGTKIGVLDADGIKLIVYKK